MLLLEAPLYYIWQNEFWEFGKASGWPGSTGTHAQSTETVKTKEFIEFPNLCQKETERKQHSLSLSQQKPGNVFRQQKARIWQPTSKRQSCPLLEKRNSWMQCSSTILHGVKKQPAYWSAVSINRGLNKCWVWATKLSRDTIYTVSQCPQRRWKRAA